MLPPLKIAHPEKGSVSEIKASFNKVSFFIVFSEILQNVKVWARLQPLPITAGWTRLVSCRC